MKDKTTRNRPIAAGTGRIRQPEGHRRTMDQRSPGPDGRDRVHRVSGGRIPSGWLILCLSLVLPVQAREVWHRYSGGFLTLSCYTAEAVCARAGLIPQITGSNSGQCIRPVDNQGASPFAIWFDASRTCPSGQVNSDADPDGCWARLDPQRCVPLRNDCPAGQVFDGEIRRCASPSLPDPDLGGAACLASSGGLSPLVANPIHAATGNKFEFVVEVDPVAGTALRFERYYNSQSRRHARAGMGRRWTHTYSARLVPVGRDASAGVFVYRPQGDGHFFARVGMAFASQTLPADRLIAQASGWQLTRADDRLETYDDRGWLVAVRHPDGTGLSLTYDDLGHLRSVTDDVGRALTLEHDGRSLLTSVTDPNGARWRFSYDLLGNLVESIQPDATPGDDSDNPRRTYLYENRLLPWHLTGVIDERGNRVATWRYDALGRAVASERAEGTDRYSLRYSLDGTTSVVDPLGRERVYRFTVVHGVVKVAMVQGGACSRCGLGDLAFVYGADGFLRSKTDAKGDRVTYRRDASGRELNRTEAVDTPLARTIRTTWQEGSNRPLTITQPGRLTAFSYDAAGRILSSSIRPLP